VTAADTYAYIESYAVALLLDTAQDLAGGVLSAA